MQFSGKALFFLCSVCIYKKLKFKIWLEIFVPLLVVLVWKADQLDCTKRPVWVRLEPNLDQICFSILSFPQFFPRVFAHFVFLFFLLKFINSWINKIYLFVMQIFSSVFWLTRAITNLRDRKRCIKSYGKH